MDTTFLTLGLFLIGIGFLLMLADLFLASGVMFVLALASMIVGVVFVFKHDTLAGLYALTAVGIGVPASAWTLLRIGPLRRMVMPTSSPEDTIAAITTNQELEKLLGQYGRTISTLRPAGVVDFDGRRVDSLTEGMMIEPDQWVRCIEVRAGRVIVRRADKSHVTELETAIFK
jgi:membrane-bound serine protease (ClpP class)